MTAGLNAFILRRDRLIVLASLGAIIVASWVYLLTGTGMDMGKMDMGGGEIMIMRPEWTPGYVLLVLATWSVMMGAMMLPSAAPAMLEAAELAGGAREALPATLSFVSGYLAVWTCFAGAATALQWGLDAGGLLSESMAINDTRIAASVVIAVGLYQLTPWKQHFLRHCRASPGCATPDGRMGAGDALRQGVRYGASCLGCCWALMVLMFVGGAMNILWMAAIALWVLAEKSLSFGGQMARLAGIALVACGGAWVTITGIWAGDGGGCLGYGHSRPVGAIICQYRYRKRASAYA